MNLSPRPYNRTFELIHEKAYIEKLRDTLPRQSRRVAEIYTKANKYLELNTGKKDLSQ